jgi:hypothetical protein
MDPLEIKRNGYSLADCAEIMDRMSVLKTEHGEPGYRAPFQQFLRSKGLTEGAWATVYNDWYQVMQNDPQLAAKFHTYLAQVRQRQMMANQPNVSGEAMEGVTLESFAKISAQIQTGAAVEGLVAGEGLTMAQWQRGQAAWGQRMGSISPTDPIMIQFAQLYQKWSPNHQAMMEASTAAALEDAANREGRGGGMSKELDMSNAHEFFDNPDVRIRARGVREMIRIWELNSTRRDAQMRQLTQRAFDEAIKILTWGAGDDRPGIMALDRPADAMEIHAWSAIADQESTQQGTSDLVLRPLKDLAAEQFMTPQQNEAARAAVQYAIARLQPRAQRVEQAFASTRDDLKRTQLRSLVDSYRETLKDLQEALGDWSYNGPEVAAGGQSFGQPSFGAPSFGHGAPTAVAVPAQASGGFLAMLKSLPVIGPILRMLGL